VSSWPRSAAGGAGEALHRPWLDLAATAAVHLSPSPAMLASDLAATAVATQTRPLADLREVTSLSSSSPAVLVDPMSSSSWMGFGEPRRWAQQAFRRAR